MVLVRWALSIHLKNPVHEILHCVLADDGIQKLYSMDKITKGNALFG